MKICCPEEDASSQSAGRCLAFDRGDGKVEDAEEVKKSHPKANILKARRVVFNIKGNDYRLISLVDYGSGSVMIRWHTKHWSLR